MSPSLNIGDIRLTFVSGGKLRIDGGNMFGVIPRVMWEQKSPPDEQHRISLDTNCILVRTGGSLGLIDTGYGAKTPQKQRLRFALDDGKSLVRNLAAIGVEPGDIDWVILTHLHFDHAGGATYQGGDSRLRPTFPRARHYVQRAEWEDAAAQRAELAGAYFPEDFAPLEEAGLIELIDGAQEIVPGVIGQLTGCHTRGHQVVRLESAGESAVCLADMCPTVAHLPIFWTMAYDQFPLEVRRVKPGVLNDIADNNRIALFLHDPRVLAARISKKSEAEWNVKPLAEW
jgi:glyoxylase-like metal-dependent hydrolase (beta-lactamase superfamily II)